MTAMSITTEISNSSQPVILFVPVSTPKGIGEYMRSTIIADAISQQWPQSQVHFVISRQAPYARQCPYHTHLTESSPTKHVAEVNAIIDRIKPDLVIFDASGRRAQLQHAHDSGAKVVFISQHNRKLNRGLKLRRLQVTDSHWVVQPEFVMTGISHWQRHKLKWLNKASPIFAGPVFTPVHPVQQSAILEQLGLQRQQFILFNAGSGGHQADGELAADLFARLATHAATQSSLKMVMVFGANYPAELPTLPGVIVVGQLTNPEFINLLEASKAAVLSGGDSLLQAISLRKPVLTAPVSKDQPARIDACEKQQVILASAADNHSLKQGIEQLLTPVQQQRLVDRMNQLDLDNGLTIALKEVSRLLDQ